MRRVLAVVVAGLALLPLGVARADAPPGIDREYTLAGDGAIARWTGTRATGMNQYYWMSDVGNVGPLETGRCDKTQQYYCDQILIKYANPVTQAEQDAGVSQKTRFATVTLDRFSRTPGPVTDFDLVIYESDATGARGSEVTHDGDSLNTIREWVGFNVTTTTDEPEVYRLVRVVYYQVVDGNYRGTATF